MDQIRLFNEDCLVAIKELPENSVDSIVTDPPYGLSFMNKKWDYDVPSTEIWEECLRVLKPGGHLLSFGGSRTYHRMAVRIEDAGFEIRDQIMWIYGSGFPKSYNIGKAIDKIQGNEREVVGEKVRGEFEGYGTALKPAHEPLVLARKPFKGGVADNVLEWGTGGLNIDESRVGEGTGETKTITQKGAKFKTWSDDALETRWHEQGFNKSEGNSYEVKDLGRFPANVIFDEAAGEILDSQSGYSKSNTKQGNIENKGSGVFLKEDGTQATGHKHKVYPNTIQDEGGASRFFYCAKASKKDRNEGLDNFEDKASQMNSGGIGRKISVEKRLETNDENAPTMKNIHPTVKPTKLMEYLIKLITPKGGIVLDPFMGSGSTGKAAIKNDFNFIGIEREKEYFDIAKARIEYVKGSGLFAPEINQDEL
jgi:site-specific DNA-methyltransferase (adenine-specific)